MDINFHQDYCSIRISKIEKASNTVLKYKGRFYSKKNTFEIPDINKFILS